MYWVRGDLNKPTTSAMLTVVTFNCKIIYSNQVDWLSVKTISIENIGNRSVGESQAKKSTKF